MIEHTDLEDLIFVTNKLRKKVILKNNQDSPPYFILNTPFFDYESLYIYKDFLCGDFTLKYKSYYIDVCTFEIPIYNNKQFSNEFLRFLHRTIDFNKLFNKLPNLKLKNKPIMSMILKDKMVKTSFKDVYTSYCLFK